MATRYSPLLLVALTLSMSFTFTSCSVIGNSSVACSRGQTRTKHSLNCDVLDPTGEHKVIMIHKVFYGATLSDRGCHRTAPFSSCCELQATECIFTQNSELNDFVKRCKAAIECELTARSVSISPTECDLDLYPEQSSFTFIEYECVKPSDLLHLCTPQQYIGMTGEMYFEDSFIRSIGTPSETLCRCVAATECNSTLTVTAMYVQLRGENGLCSQKLRVSDVSHHHKTSLLTCDNHDALFNEVVFESESNAVEIERLTGEKPGAVLIKVASTTPSDKIRLYCGEASLDIQGCNIIWPDQSKTESPKTSSGGLTRGGSDGVTQPLPVNNPTSFSLSSTLVIAVIISSVVVLITTAVLTALFIRFRRRSLKPAEPENNTALSTDLNGYDNDSH